MLKLMIVLILLVVSFSVLPPKPEHPCRGVHRKQRAFLLQIF